MPTIAASEYESLCSVPWKVDANLATVTKDLQPLAGQLHPHPVPPSLESYRAVLLDQAGVEPTEHSLSPVDARVVGSQVRGSMVDADMVLEDSQFYLLPDDLRVHGVGVAAVAHRGVPAHLPLYDCGEDVLQREG